MKTKTLILFMLLSVLCYIFWLFACGSNENHVTNKHIDGSICVVFAHPDDETIISGTLAMLAAKDFDITVVYVTSGDDGPDETGRGLYRDTLAAERENESLQSLQAIGIKNPPVFLRFPDSHVPEYVDAVTQALYDLFNKITPQIVISFSPDGITDDWDHKMSGFAADFVFDLTDSGRLLLDMAISKNLSPFYVTGIDVSEHAVNVRVNVAPYTNQRIRALEVHRTQFNSRVRFIYKALVQTMPTEEFIIARNRDAGQWLEKCFDIQEEKNKSNSEMIADSVFTSTD